MLAPAAAGAGRTGLVAARQRAWWLVGGVLLAIFVPPAFSGKYRPILDGRYLMPLVPVLFVAIGLAWRRSGARWRQARAGTSGTGRPGAPRMGGRAR